VRTMYDSLVASSIPRDAEMVAGYIDGAPGFPFWSDDDWALFPNAVKVRIATQPHTDDGHVLDVEAGNASPEQAPAWVTMRREAGMHPSVYCSEAFWEECIHAFTDQGVGQPEWWIAGYPGSVGEGKIYEGAVAHQYVDVGPYDLSAVADYWPGVDVPPMKGHDVFYQEKKDDGTFAYWVPVAGGLMEIDGGMAYAFISAGVPMVKELPSLAIVGLGVGVKKILKDALA
jgi:hypothetical protein